MAARTTRLRIALFMLSLMLVSGCRLAPTPERRGLPAEPAPAPAEPAPAAPGGSAVPSGQAAAATPDLAGGPEDGGRPHFEPPTPPKTAYMRGDPRHRTIALTFDDGPDTVYTPRILDVLKQNGAHATFYLVGSRARAHPDLVRRIIREGHEIGNHTLNHANLSKLSPEQVRREMAEANRILEALAGKPVTTFRPPYGNATAAVESQARALGYRLVLWDIDSLDWKKGVTARGVLDNVLPSARNGGIVLQHSAGGKGEDLSNTVEALPLLIKTLRGQGYRLVTISEMLKTGNPKPGTW